MEIVKTGRAFLSLPSGWCPLISSTRFLALGFVVGFVFAMFAFKPGMDVGLPLNIPISSTLQSYNNSCILPHMMDDYINTTLHHYMPSPSPPILNSSASSTTADHDYRNHAHQDVMPSPSPPLNSSASSITADHEYRNHVHQDVFPSARKLAKCDLFRGKWIKDDTRYPLYKPDTCPFVTSKFNCQQNGRPDTKYTRWRWAPRGCKSPRFSGKHMLESLRGKRLVFVGDSLNHNQWESMLCMLRESLVDRSRVVQPRRSLHVLKFLDYNCTVEFYPSLYLVDIKGSSQETNYIIRLDTIDTLETKWRTADVLVFNTGHWWGPNKIANGENRFQEGDKVYDRFDVRAAYKKALSTWGQWVDTHIDPNRTRVFFRTLSPQHYGRGKGKLGRHCGDETEPMRKESHVAMQRNEMRALEEVIGAMKVRVLVLNVTNLSAYRKDAHPSVYWDPQKPMLGHPDCGHWCLPGVPDTWNELLYFSLIKNMLISP